MKLKYYLRGLGIGIVVTALLMGGATKDANHMSDEEVKARARELGMVEQRTLADVRENTEQMQEPVITELPEEMQGTETPQLTEAPDEQGDFEPTASKEPEKTDEPQTTIAPEATNHPIGDESPELTEEPATSESPQETEEPETSESPQETEEPETSESPQETEEPETSESPQETEEPETSENLQGTEEPVTSEKPQGTEVPATTVPGESEAPEDTQGTGIDVEATPRPLPTVEISGDIVRITIYEGNNSVNVSRALESAGLIEDALEFDRYLRKTGYSKIINTGVYKIALGTPEEEVAHIITNTN